MKLYQNSECIECECNIENRVYNYSIENFGIPLCRDCQYWVRDMEHQTTTESLMLYFELRKRKVPAELEKFDGHKTIDIAVTDARVNIEVDGGQHNYNARQAMSDLKRTYHAFTKGYLTLRIPNSLVKNHLEETADLITDFLIVSKQNKTQRRIRKRW